MRFNLIGFVAFFVGVCLPLAAQQDVNFFNSDGTFTGTSATSGDLSLSSTLVGVSGFAGDLSGYNVMDGNIGTLNFSTGALVSTQDCTTLPCTSVTPTMVPLSNQTSDFGPGGQFKVKDAFDGGFGGFTFKGSFSGASWACAPGGNCHLVAGHTNEWKGTWSFTGTITNAVILIDGQTIQVGGAITIQATTVKDVVVTMSNGSLTFTDASGTTNFTGNFSVAPEPGTLSLLGSGLIALGFAAKRRLGMKV